MKLNKKSEYFRAFGLTVLSEIHLPELVPLKGVTQDKIDIMIEIDNLAELWENLSVTPQQRFVVTEDLVIFNVPDIAIFSVKEGRIITVSPNNDYDEEIARLYILGTCMGALLMQRRIYPLHGSAIVINGKAYAFVGDQGAGKSTLAATFLNKEYHLLSDDVIGITFSKDNVPFVIPAYPQQKLWQESLVEFGFDKHQYRSIYGRETKFCVPVVSKYFPESLPLAGIVELTKSNNNSININRIVGLERLRTLSYHTYRNFLIPGLGLIDWHFNSSAIIANQIELFRLERPNNRFTANELASLILDKILV